MHCLKQILKDDNIIIKEIIALSLHKYIPNSVDAAGTYNAYVTNADFPEFLQILQYNMHLFESFSLESCVTKECACSCVLYIYIYIMDVLCGKNGFLHNFGYMQQQCLIHIQP